MKLQISQLSTKLLAAFLSVGLIPFTIIGVIALINAQNALTNNTISRLESIRDAKKMSIQQFFETQLRNVTTLATVESVITATEMMEEAFDMMGKTIENNAIWKALSERYTPAMKNYINTFGYKDLYIISPDGDIVYSVTRKSDLGQNVLEEPLKNSPLKKCFIKTLEKGAALTDFELYKPHNNTPALFAGAVVKRSERIDGVVVIYISEGMINKIMLERSGLGQTGETYLVGNDKLMRSDSYLDPVKHSVKTSLANPEQGIVVTEASHLALSGKTGGKIIDHYRGIPVVSAFTPLKLGDMTWALIAEIDQSEAFASIKTLRFLMGLVGLIGITAIIFVSLLISSRISDPLKKLTRATEEISQGRLDVFLDPTLMESSDEIGVLSTSFNTMTGQLKRSMEDLMEEISERKRLTTILDSTTDMVSISTPDAKITYMNQAGRKLVGWEDEEDINSKTIPDVHPEWALSIVKNEGIPAAIQNNVWTGETALLRKDGTEIPASQVIMAHKSPEGELEYLSTIIRDISDRKQTEEALRESEEKYRNFIDNAPVGMYTINTKGEFTYGNKKLLEITGYTPEYWLNKPFHPIVHPDDLDIVMQRVGERLAGEGTTDPYEIRMINSSGDIMWVKINSQSIYDTDEKSETKLVGMQSFLEDITDNKFAEEALRESEEKLARAKKMESVGLFAGGVAHDLNNVLSGIVSYPELLLLDLPKESKLRKPIETIQETGHRAAAIVQDLLTVARGVAITKEPLNLNAIVEDYLLSHEFEELKRFHATVTIKSNLAADLLNIIASDTHLRKVVMNLVLNASEAIEGSGNVSISTMNRYIDRPVRGYDDVNVGEYVILSISDNGPGISPDDLERIFEPFYTKKVMGRSGTGLGLAVVWNVVQDLKGYLDVISDENGTTFELYFPITRDELSDKDLSIPIIDYKGDGETVLVVDDVESQREIACEMLNILGYEAKAVSSGEEAVEHLTEHTVDLILLDMIMDPGINGRETYERIIKIHPNQKAVIASGFAETDDVREAQKLGAGQYIKKPLTLEKMGLAIRDELKK